ncbi:hypothetical protein FJ444_13885 [Aestuariibacter sp. GS-14]|uniref:hypothetical protein n=1 Tax=Aestuariibacter sp. GS-14 TaxID=2590670 RepID=UPI00112DE095|nr:hypothetical protein [Aestuariibacter sp. GS-14]TPV56845.1 hypothetical protein FJ444_13885 [Aestuariibacter sp. GS-14]
MSMELKKQSNPFSTGGGGVNFETRVQSAFALSLFTKSCIPCMSKLMRAKEIRFQAKYDGVETDDFVLVASDNSGNKSHLFAQIKHEITISESQQSVFAEVINSAWKDFKKSTFSLELDRIALITGPLPKVDVNNTLPLLEWAKYSANSQDFLKKCNTNGFSSKSKLQRLETFKKQLANANGGRKVTDDELWGFLKTFQILSFDLDSQHSVVANLLCSLINIYSEESPSLVLSKLVSCVQEFNQNAGILTASNIPIEIQELFTSSPKIDFENDLVKLQERSEHIFEGISNTIQGVHIERPDQTEKISRSYASYDFLFVTGARGVGKSGAVKDFILTKNVDVPVFYLRAEDLDKSHLNDVFATIGMTSSLGQIEGHFSLLKEKILVIESLEKVLELNYPDTFSDLLQYIKRQSGWTIIATGRDYAYQQIIFTYLQPSDIQFSSVSIDALTDKQIHRVCDHIPPLKNLVSNSSLGELLKVPFFIDIAARAIVNGAVFSSGDNENDFRETVWRTVISKEADRKFGMPEKRKQTFINIAKERAKKMLFGVRVSDFEPDVVAKLEEDNLILRDAKTSTVSPMHDVLEDWALEEFIESEYLVYTGNIVEFLSGIGSEPAISRAFRLWLFRKLKCEDNTNEFIENLLKSSTVQNYWKDEAISAVLQHQSPERFIYSLKSDLLSEDCALLIRFCFILRITCQRPNPKYNNLLAKDVKSGMLKSLFLQPFGNGWKAIFDFVYEVRESLSKAARIQLVEVIDEWCGLINIYEELPKASCRVGLLSLWLLEQVKDSHKNKRQRKKILSALLKTSTSVEGEFNSLMDKDVFISKRSPRRLGYVEQLTSLAFVGIDVAMLCKRNPDFIVKLALHEWLLEKPEEDEFGYGSYGEIEVEEHFGLERERDFFPASGAKGPFKYLLRSNPRLGLDFIIKLCNITAQKYSESDFAAPRDNEQERFYSYETVVDKVIIPLNDGSNVSQYCSNHLWKGYRGLSTLPYVLQCALMALENWLIDYIKDFDETNQIERIFDYLLRSSNSVMPTSVLASVAIGFPEKVGKAAYPLLKTSRLYDLDLVRMTAEKGGNEHHYFGLDRDVMTSMFIEERRTAALREWRKESLETLLTRLQFNTEHRDCALEILDELIAEANSDNNKNLRFMVHRVDTRTWKAVEDKENNRVLLQSSTELPEDLMKEQQAYNKKHAIDNSVITLNLWGRKIFEEQVFEDKYFDSYSSALLAAQELLQSLQKNEVGNFAEMAVGTITIVAAACVRDAFEELCVQEKEWCFNVILESIFMHAHIVDGTTAYDTTDYYGTGACAFVLPRLFDLELDPEQVSNLKYAMATALTHENLDVSQNLARGIREFLWTRDSKLATYFVRGAVAYAKFRRENNQQRKFYHLQNEELKQALENWNSLINSFHEDLIEGRLNQSVSKISFQSHSSCFFHLPMLMIPLGPVEDEYIRLVQNTVNMVYENEYADYRQGDDEQIHHDIVKHIQDCLTDHIIHSRNNDFLPFKELLISGCSLAPSFIYSLVLSFNVAVEKIENYEAIWSLWSLLEPEMHKIALNDVNERYRGRQSDLTRLLRGMMYADTPWQGHENEAKDMNRGAVYLLEFAKCSASNSHVFEALASLIYNFHNVFFNEGIKILSQKFSHNSQLISKQVNTAFYLEMTIGRYLQIENRGTLSRSMYEVCLGLLNGIVETGSARAYYLREHLIRSRRVR